MGKRANKTKEEDDNQGESGFPDIVWILPFMTVGAMFGSLVGATIGHALGQTAPFGPALIGIIVGMFFVAAIGLLAMRSLQSG